jgi:flagellar protein FliS
MHARARRAYVDSQIETSITMARPIDLVVMVYQRVLDHAETARVALIEGKDPEESIGKALDLIETGLRVCLNHEVGGEISRNLENIYAWGSNQLLCARLKREPALIEDFQRVFSKLAEAWNLHAEEPENR